MDDHASNPPFSPPAVCIIVSRYNGSVTTRLREGAERAYRGRFPDAPAPVVVEAPGTFELPALASAAIESGRFDGVVALGCVIRGETDHDKYIAQAVANALSVLSVQTVAPVGFGVLTVNTPEQARARAGGEDGQGPGNKGVEAMEAVLDSISAMAGLLELDAAGDTMRITREVADKVPGEAADAGER